MRRYTEGEDREQKRIEPLCFDEMIANDNQVRAIDIVVESIDIPSLSFAYSKTKETGRKPYNPKDMFKLYSSLVTTALFYSYTIG